MKSDLSDYNGVGLLFPSDYLQADDLRGKDVTVTIASIEPRHELKGENNRIEHKPVVTVKNGTKKWVLNKTNAKTIAKKHGKPMDWIGKQVTLYPTTCTAFGETVDCIRVRK
jgi:hypothetical protein